MPDCSMQGRVRTTGTLIYKLLLCLWFELRPSADTATGQLWIPPHDKPFKGYIESLTKGFCITQVC